MQTNYKHFGVMIDCSRNAVLKVGSVKKMIVLLQKMGYNTLELYTEDTYEVDGEPYFGYLRGRYSAEEIKEIDKYAARHGIELIPCIQTLAHFTNPVKLPRFNEITDVNDIFLIDEPKTYEFLERVFASLAENFTSRNVNIGMDEAHMVGLGKYLDKHGPSDRFEIICRHLGKVAEIAAKYGFTAHMWSDMFFRLASNGKYYDCDVQLPDEVLDKVPANVALTYWDYYHNEKAHYDNMFALNKKFGREVWFAGGAWTWAGFAPHNKLSDITMKPAMESVRENNIENVFITMWGDDGGECPPFAALGELYAIRRFADGEFDRSKIAAEFDKLMGVSMADLDLLGLPDQMADVDPYHIPTPCKALLYSDPFLGIADHAVSAHAEIPYGEYAKQLAAAKKRAGEYAYLFESSEKLCAFLDKKAYLGIRTRKAYRAGDKKALKAVSADYAQAEKRLDAFFVAFETQWNTVNKPFGFEVQCARLGGVKQRLIYCRKRIEAYLGGKADSIEELEEDILPLNPAAPDKMCFMNFNFYRRMVSTSEI